MGNIEYTTEYTARKYKVGTKCLKGTQKTHKGWTFKLKESIGTK